MYSTTLTTLIFVKHILLISDNVFECRLRGIAFVLTFNKVCFFVNNCINVYYVTLVLLPIVVCHQCFSFRVTPQRNWIYHLHPSQATIREQCVQTGSVSLGLDKLRCVLFY